MKQATRAFSEEEREQSSTWQELAAVRDTWTNTDVLEQFRGCKVAHYMDSQAMAAIIVKGSRNPKLQPMIIDVVLALRWYSISMVAVWKSREDGLISYANSGSRDFYKDGVSLDFESMLNIVGVFGDFEVDM